MELTTKLNLKKPGLTDYVNISDLNDNMDILDVEVGALKEGTTEVPGLETIDKTYKGAINEIKNDLGAHKAEYAIQTATGTANVITITTGGDFKYSQGNKISFKAISNSTGAVTINIDSKGNKPLKKLDGTNATVKANKVYEIFYSVGDNCFFLLASAEGDAIAGNVLAGKTFSNDDDSGLLGTMPNRVGYVTGQSVSINGTTLRIRPIDGFYDGEANNAVQYSDPNWIADNILAGKSIFGKVGTLAEGKKFARGATSVAPANGIFKLSIRSLNFKPSLVLAKFLSSNDLNGFSVLSISKDFLTSKTLEARLDASGGNPAPVSFTAFSNGFDINLSFRDNTQAQTIEWFAMEKAY